jgi:hypothetical protein
MPYSSYLAATIFCVYVPIYILSQGDGDLVKEVSVWWTLLCLFRQSASAKMKQMFVCTGLVLTTPQSALTLVRSREEVSGLGASQPSTYGRVQAQGATWDEARGQ